MKQQVGRILVHLDAPGIAQVRALPPAAGQSDDRDPELAGGLGVVGCIA